ncbi:MAG: site-specific integrase [Micropruina sp.]|uniref:tyrosine-type recombinase/integrase n=1 Tax=Micropruina sp. TaxID=2737536 RepID=UPI0039E553CC
MTSLLADAVSFFTVPESVQHAWTQTSRGFFRALLAVLIADRARFDGVDLHAGDVWDCALLGMLPSASRPYPSTYGTVLDFRAVHQIWLRELTKAWAKHTNPYVMDVRVTLKAMAAASIILLAHPHADDPKSLSRKEITAIIDGFRSGLLDGVSYSISHRRTLFNRFRAVLDFGRAAGLMDEIPGTFTVVRTEGLAYAKSTGEDLLGRAIPEHVIDQLNRQMPLLGDSHYEAGGWTSGDFQRMYQTVVQVMRDTGRRPGEVVSLQVGCVKEIQGKPTLVYDNHKAGRPGRRLPINASTADIIARWEAHLSTLPGRDYRGDWLFPAPGRRGRVSQPIGFLSPSQVFRQLRRWLDVMPQLVDEGLDDNGGPVLFDHGRVTLYAFRHSYAQRHADAGTPVDVLRRLMDHASVMTTMGYYTISLERRRTAVAALSSLMVDRNGRRLLPIAPTDYELGTVAVPYGNCAEPSNVKAGGGHCPIRFQCAGCNFYRPDPSYLPAITAHVAELRVNKEEALAAGAAEWVTRNIDDQITSFHTVQAALASLVDSLPETAREELSGHSREMRRAREVHSHTTVRNGAPHE